MRMSKGEEAQKLRYTIGQFASILGITTDTLRLYEKHEIVSPEKDDHNKYRYFNDLDARNLLMSRWFRSAEIPLQEAAVLVNESTSSCILQSFEESRQNIQAEIIHKQRLLVRITEIMNEIQQAESHQYECQIKQLQGFYRIKQTNKNELLQRDGLQQVISRWMDQLPFLFYSFRIENSHVLLSPQDHDFEYSWGISLPEHEVADGEHELLEEIEYIPPATCLSSYIALQQEGDISPKHLKHMRDHLVELGYLLSGDIVGRIIFMEKTKQHARTFLEINIPINL